jgi:hypothetical protein
MSNKLNKNYNDLPVFIKPKSVLIHICPQMIQTTQGIMHGAKFFPLNWWGQIINAYPNYRWTQIGRLGDWVINGVVPQFNLTLPTIKTLALDSDYIICVDSFLQHLLAPTKKKLIVLWSKSDPNIFGYKHNINLLKDRSYLRPDQYGVWNVCPPDQNAFIDPNVIIDLLK